MGGWHWPPAHVHAPLASARSTRGSLRHARHARIDTHTSPAVKMSVPQPPVSLPLEDTSNVGTTHNLNRTIMNTTGNRRHLDQLFREAVAKYASSNGQGYPRRIVLARDINIPEGYEPLQGRLDNLRPGFQHERRRFESPSAPPIPVIERSDGTLWTYENVPMLTLFHEMASLARLQVVIIASDPTPPQVSDTVNRAPRRP